MKMIRLICIDLDGTLFDDDKNISEDNLKALREAKKMGARVVITTGRPKNGVKPILKRLGLTTNEDYVIIYNGAFIYNAGTDEVIHTTTIGGAIVKRLYNESRRLGLHYHAFRDNEELLTVDKNPYTDVETSINKIEDHVYDFNLVKDSDRFIKAMLVDSFENLNKATALVSEDLKNELTMVRSSKIFLEFLNPNTSKGEALKFLANYLGIPIEETMAIGDAGNDLPMLMAAGIGVCMENAFPEIKAKCKYFTDSNLNSGVARAIERFVLNK